MRSFGSGFMTIESSGVGGHVIWLGSLKLVGRILTWGLMKIFTTLGREQYISTARLRENKTRDTRGGNREIISIHPNKVRMMPL